jgi:hypothetical protein
LARNGSPDALIRDGKEKYDWNRLVETMVADVAANQIVNGIASQKSWMLQSFIRNHH